MTMHRKKNKKEPMRMATAFRRILRGFLREERGVAYLEFALCLPFLLLLFGGSIDVTRMVLLHQKVDKAVFTVGDLATQLELQSGLCNTIRNWQNTVVKDMVKPFSWDAGGFQFVMSSVIGARPNGQPNGAVQDLIEWRYNTGVPSIIGSYSQPYTQIATLPPSIQGLAQNERVIVTEMSYQFRPMLPLLSGLETTQFRKVSYFRSRITTGTTGKASGPLSQLGTCS